MPTVETKKEIEKLETQANSGKKSIWESFETCLKKYAKFKGRASRHEFWSFYLVVFLISFALSFVDVFVFQFEVLSTIFSIAVLIPGISVSVRRLHDVNKSGWWYLFPWLSIPLLVIFSAVSAIIQYSVGDSSLQTIGMIVSGILLIGGSIYLFYLYCKRGDKTANDFGEPPLF